jgi:hypothetical protein
MVSVGNGFIKGTTDICDDKWHQIAVVLDNDGTANVTEVKMYINGLPENISSSQSQNISTSEVENVKIGVFNGNYFDGYFDEIAVFDRALSLRQLQQLYYLSVESLENPCGALDSNSENADLDLNCSVDLIDYSILANNYGQSSAVYYQGDLDSDGTITINDIAVLSNHWLFDLTD